MANPSLCERMGAAGRKRVEETFAWQAIAAQTVELYRSLVGLKSENPTIGAMSCADHGAFVLMRTCG